MNYRMKLSAINLVVWTLSFVISTVVFFKDTLNNELPQQNFRVTTAVIFVLANIINLIIVYFQNRNEKPDERNKRFESLSAVGTMIAIMIIFFLSTISLYIFYEESGFVPVDWLWYMAYGAVYMVFILFNISYIVVSLKGTSYED